MSIMKAVVLDAPGPPEALQIRDLPIPTPRPGEVLIKVAAFGHRSRACRHSHPPDTLAATKVHGVVCFTGMLSNVWTVRDFYPIDYIPRGVRLTAYTGEATDLQTGILQDFLDAVAAGEAIVPLHRVYHLDEIREAHAEMEAGSATGKIVVLTEPGADQSGSLREEHS